MTLSKEMGTVLFVRLTPTLSLVPQKQVQVTKK